MQNQLTNLTDLIMKFVNSNATSTLSSSTLSRNTIANPKSDLKAITTRSGVSYDRPQIPPKVVENVPEVIKDTMNPTNNENTKDVQPQAVQSESSISTSNPVTSPIAEPTIARVSASRPNPKASIPYPSRRNDERNREKANFQIEKFYQIFKDMSFEISFADALILMPKFGSTLKALIGNKEKLSEMARTPLNEHCFVVLLKKLPEKLGDPCKFLISCDFPSMVECLALADLGASINLMPFFVWKRLPLPYLIPTCMTLKLANHSISRPVGVAEDVYVKVGSFYFSVDFVVVNFDADPRVPLILRRSFLKTERALIDVFEGELTLRVGKEAITFNMDQNSRYSANYNDMTAKRIDVIDMACEEYSQEVLGFSDTISSGSPTPYYDPIVSATSSTLTPFENSDFLLEEVNAFLAIEDEPTSSKFHQSYLDPEGDVLLLEAFLNDDPSLPPPNQRNYMPEVRKELKICDDKLPVIIAKDLSVEEKIALITILKSHKRAIAWKLSDIKGINPEFCTHKILIEEDFTPAVQHQRRVNPKIYDVIKQEVIKLLDAGLIYPISDSPWVSSVHYVPKKGGFIVVENEDNELIPTRLVMGWRELTFKVVDTKGAENLAADYLSRLENPHQNVLDPKEINESFPLETLNLVSTRGPFSSSRGNKYKLVAVDYLSKWVEVKALPTNDSRVVFKFLKNLFSRFGAPRAIISDRGTHFCNDQFTKLMQKYGVTHRLVTPYHPQTSGQVEVSNRGLKRILERTVGENRAFWLDKLDDALWAFRIAYKTPIGCTPYKLVYEKTCHLPVELEHKAYWALKHANFDLKTAGDHRKIQINELNELRDQAYENSLIYKEKTKRLRDSKIKNRVFNIGDRVLLFNSRLNIFSGKLKSRWSGPFTISQVFPYGTIELSQPNGPNFKVNGHRIKHYFGEDIPRLVVYDLQTFAMDH
uniref:Reverse transcriptase domain-containing protein n=1 Tax=Tanacetum cinerariifolium TaxID=118510 RepID=A0A6L2P3G2_TANCI|nr:reverse transcriptase domain-containing protein [Tanacetum cinerariifolium]